MGRQAGRQAGRRAGRQVGSSNKVSKHDAYVHRNHKAYRGRGRGGGGGGGGWERGYGRGGGGGEEEDYSPITVAMTWCGFLLPRSVSTLLYVHRDNRDC